MKAEVERLLTRSAVTAAGLLRGHPGALEKLTRVGGKYLDWRGREVVCQTRFGARMACNLGDLIQRKIAYFGLWEPHLTAYMTRVLAPGDVLADVGANIGYYSLLGAGLVGRDGQVVAIEASRSIFAHLCGNIRRNRLTNVRAVNVAVAFAREQLPVFDAPASNIGRTSTIAASDKVFAGLVEALPLHEILTPTERARLRLVKIDIEGAEGPVVESIRQNISAYPDRCEFVIEVSPECNWIIATMREIGFHAYRIPNDYGDGDYLRGEPQRPLRHFAGQDEQCDFIFSRIDADRL